jgi:hypothetical protein
MTNKWRDFKFFDWSDDPIGKYKQPEPNPRVTKGSGYPVDETDMTGTKTYGRYIRPLNGDKKERMEIRGCKNTERGKRFYDDNQDRQAPRTKGRKQVSSEG